MPSISSASLQKSPCPLLTRQHSVPVKLPSASTPSMLASVIRFETISRNPRWCSSGTAAMFAARASLGLCCSQEMCALGCLLNSHNALQSASSAPAESSSRYRCKLGPIELDSSRAASSPSCLACASEIRDRSESTGLAGVRLREEGCRGLPFSEAVFKPGGSRAQYIRYSYTQRSEKRESFLFLPLCVHQI